MTDQLKDFKAALEQSGQPFMSMALQDSGCAHIRFTGLFQGREIIWDARVMTLRHIGRAKQRENATASKHTGGHQFIEVGEEEHQIRRLVVGLDVALIDRPVLLKTIVMIRNYKRLQYGRHEYGRPIP